MRRFYGKSLLSALTSSSPPFLASAFVLSSSLGSSSTATSKPSPAATAFTHGAGGSESAQTSSLSSAASSAASAGKRDASSSFPQGSLHRGRGDRRTAGDSPSAGRTEGFDSHRSSATSSSISAGKVQLKPASLRRRTVSEAKARKPARKEALLIQSLSSSRHVPRGRRAAGDAKCASTEAKPGVPEEPAEPEEATLRPTPSLPSSTKKLLAHAASCNFIAKWQDAFSAMATPLTSWWARGPSDSTLREVERQLDLVIRQASFDAYAALRESMRRRFVDPLTSVGSVAGMTAAAAAAAVAASESSGHLPPNAYSGNERLLLLYAHLLVNYGAFCLLNSEPQRAVSLLREAVATTQAASAAAARQQQQQQQQQQQEKVTESGETVEEVPQYGETAVLYTRLFLANALSCDRLYWQAAEQYTEVLRVLDVNPCDLSSAADGEEGGAASGPTAALSQLSPGPHAFLPLSRQFIREDAMRFFEDADRLRKALSQGQAHELLLQSQGVSQQVLSDLRLTMARVYRYGSAYCRSPRGAKPARGRGDSAPSLSLLTPVTMLQESKRLYEAYLDDLVVREEEDTQHAMLELGRMICENPAAAAGEGISLNDTKAVSTQLHAGLVYLEAASEVFLEEAELALAHRMLTHSQKQLVVRAACVLVDVAEAHVRNEDEARALGLYEGSVDLLSRAGLSCISAWVLQRYADVLSSVSFVDRAIARYTAAMEILRVNEHYGERDEDAPAVPHSSVAGGDAPLQLGPRQSFVRLSNLDVEASLAYCYQVYVGDPRRAVWHYTHVLDSILSAGKRQSNGNSQEKKGVAGGEAAAATSSLSSSPHVTTRGRRRFTPTFFADTVPDVVMPPDREHYVLTNMVACCERLQDWDTAIAAQNRLIALEAASGNRAVAACLRSVVLMEMKGDYTTMLGVLFYLLLLPAEDMETSVRLTVTHYFVKCCYALGNQTMGSVLLNAVYQIEGDNSVAVVLDWAVNAEKLDAAARLTVYDAADMKADIKTIADTFLRAAQMLIAHRTSDEADAAAEGGRAPHAYAVEDKASVPAEAAGAVTAVAAANMAATRRVEMERDSLITLSRGAFFFHQNGYNAQAEELYAAAVRYADAAEVPQVVDPSGLPPELVERYNEYNRELAILLANYATLKLSTDPAQAEGLYTRAAAIRPAPLEVAEVVADYCVQSGNYVQGAVHMARVIEAHPESAVEMHSRMARLGCGPPWSTLTPAQRLEVHEHLVLGLGVSPSFVPKYAEDAPTTAANLAERVGALDALTLEGVATTGGDEATCLACFLVQTKYPDKAKLINQLYKHAVKRFPFHTAILVNYAKFCCDYNFHTLARKLYARAYGAADGDLCRTLCYANYLSHSFGSKQAAAGEALWRYHVEREPQSSQAHMHYANYLAVMIPGAPFLAEKHFREGVRLDPQSKQLGFYAQFVWTCADNPLVCRQSDMRTAFFDQAESLFKRAVEVEPENPAALQSLGAFYANRHDRFEEAVQALYKAHKLAPSNTEVTRLLGNALLDECVRVQSEEQQRFFGAATSMNPSSSSSSCVTPMSPRLRSLVESTQQVFEKSIELDPEHRETLEKYATFAVAVLKNPSLAADLWARIHRLARK